MSVPVESARSMAVSQRGYLAVGQVNRQADRFILAEEGAAEGDQRPRRTWPRRCDLERLLQAVFAGVGLRPER